jgi:hypothetical protein
VSGIHTALSVLLANLRNTFRSRVALQLQVLALQQQLSVYQRKTPRPRLITLDRAFWVLLYRLWPACLGSLVVVKPETVVRWHRRGFRAFWTWKSRPRRGGRPVQPPDAGNVVAFPQVGGLHHRYEPLAT